MTKFVLTGSDGNLGRIAADFAIEILKPEDHLVLTSYNLKSIPEDVVAGWRAKGAEVVDASYDDVEGMKKVFEGAEAVGFISTWLFGQGRRLLAMSILARRLLSHHSFPRRLSSQRSMLSSMPQARSAKAILSHQERTATEPRENDVHTATLAKVTPVNDRIKRFKFEIKEKDGFNFLPGQWLDVFVPDVEKAGGFTITSSPSEALPRSDPDFVPYFELAVQKSPDNPPAAWLWQPVDDILGKEVTVRVGGSFVWPPPCLDMKKIKRAIFIAGGVGINPMMSMMTYINQNYPNLEVRFLYSTKVPSRETDPSEVLFLQDVLDLFRIPRFKVTKDRLELFFTGTWDGSEMGTNDGDLIHPLMSLTLPQIDSATEVPVCAWTHRIDDIALSSAVGNRKEAQSTVFYVCGPPDMTDDMVKFIKEQDNVAPERVLCEKWW